MTLDPDLPTLGKEAPESGGPIQSTVQRVTGPMANQVGKRYQCTQCNTEMIVTKAGEGTLQCCGKEMQQK